MLVALTILLIQSVCVVKMSSSSSSITTMIEFTPSAHNNNFYYSISPLKSSSCKGKKVVRFSLQARDDGDECEKFIEPEEESLFGTNLSLELEACSQSQLTSTAHEEYIFYDDKNYGNDVRIDDDEENENIYDNRSKEQEFKYLRAQETFPSKNNKSGRKEVENSFNAKLGKQLLGILSIQDRDEAQAVFETVFEMFKCPLLQGPHLKLFFENIILQNHTKIFGYLWNALDKNSKSFDLILHIGETMVKTKSFNFLLFFMGAIEYLQRSFLLHEIFADLFRTSKKDCYEIIKLNSTGMYHFQILHMKDRITILNLAAEYGDIDMTDEILPMLGVRYELIDLAFLHRNSKLRPWEIAIQNGHFDIYLLYLERVPLLNLVCLDAHKVSK